MLTQLQLEGPELEPLLARVRTELGPSARVVSAEKIRSGGVAGFFARQRFELTVEIDTSLPRTGPSSPVPAPVSGVRATASAAVAPAAEPAVAVAPPGAATTVVASAPAGPDVAGFSAIAGLDAHGTSPETTSPSAPAGVYAPAPARLPASALAAASAYAPHAATADPNEAAAVATTAPPAFRPHAAFAAIVEGTTGPPAEPSQPEPSSLLELAERISADEHDALVSTESPSFASLLTRLRDGVGAETTDASAVDGSVAPPVGEPSGKRRSRSDASLQPDAGVAAARTGSDVARSAVDAVPGAAVAVLPAADHRVEDTAGTELARLGLPTHLRPTAGGSQLHTALRASLTRLPTAPPATNRPGGVLAIVGPLALALDVARQIAEELGLPAVTSVAVATYGSSVSDVPARQVLRGAAEAAERRITWRRRSNLTVVAVEAPLTSGGAADARAFLAALSPTAIWGVVEATRKAQDVGSWTRALGGVHALALTDLEETSDPAAVLELGIPVSRLGGRAATPRAWATLLTGRLAA